MPYPKTRHSLIVRLNDEHNEPAWMEFVNAVRTVFVSYAERQGVSKADVPDVVQHVLLAVVKSVDGWKDDGREASFRRWLTTVSRNIVIKFMTRERRQVTGFGGTELVEMLHAVPNKPDQDQVRLYEHELIV